MSVKKIYIRTKIQLICVNYNKKIIKNIKDSGHTCIIHYKPYKIAEYRYCSKMIIQEKSYYQQDSSCFYDIIVYNNFYHRIEITYQLYKKLNMKEYYNYDINTNELKEYICNYYQF